MASSVSFGTVAPAAASPAGGRTRNALGRRAVRPSSARSTVPAATKVVTAAAAKQEQKGLFEAIFGARYKEEQLLETDPVLNKVGGKAAPSSKITAGKAAAAEQSGGFLGGLFKKG
jgi:hypothetical protein